MNKQELIDYCNAIKENKSQIINCIDVNRIIKKIEQLDEPKQPTLDNIIHRIKFMEEDLKQEWLSKILKELGSDFELKKFQEGFKSGSWIGRQLINTDKIRQELNKPVIPQFVADWIKYCKRTGVNLYNALDMGDLYFYNYANQKDDLKLKEFFETDTNQEIFARAWLDGYIVEEEKRYRVKIKGEIEENLLVYGLGIKRYFFARTYDSSKRGEHTRKQLEEANFGWVFDCEGIEFEEVE